MNAPRYSYSAINDLAAGDTGHFVYLDSWSVSLLASMLAQENSSWLWYNNQFPLTPSEIDDLDNKLSTAQDQLMQSLVGLIMPCITSSIPTGTLLCDGSTYLRADYPNLYAALDSAFIIDADTFQVPDLRDKFAMGSSTTNPIGTTGGSASLTQTVDQMPAHSHTNTPHTHTEVTAIAAAITLAPGVPAASAVPGVGVTGASSVVIDNTGNGQPMDITPPFVAVRYVVVAL